MRPKYDGIKCSSSKDIVRYQVEEAARIMDTFTDLQVCNDVNQAIEFYNICRIFQMKVCPENWSNEKYCQYTNRSKQIKIAYIQFFKSISDDKLIDIYEKVAYRYISDFWAIFSEIKLFENISEEAFFRCVTQSKVDLKEILVYKKLVNHYDLGLAEFLRCSNQTPYLIADKFLRPSDGKRIYFPNTFESSEFKSVFEKYIKSNEFNPGILSLIINSQSSRDCPIDDGLRLSAKSALDLYCKDMLSKGSVWTYEYQISFSDINDIFNIESKNNMCTIVFNSKWIKENLDYPTLLNNFIYLFEYFDMEWRSAFILKNYQRSCLYDALTSWGINEYKKNFEFDNIASVTLLEMLTYYDQLKKYNISMEEIFRWFFEEYLLSEFQTEGFKFSPPSEGTSFSEKCKIIASEMERVLKQFKCFVEENHIDHELLQISSSSVAFSAIGSFIDHKYAYAKSEFIEKEIKLLFSDQSILANAETTLNNDKQYESFVQLLLKNKLKISDFFVYQRQDIEWLIQRKTITLRDEFLELNGPKVFLLKDLYEKNVICCHYVGKQRAQMEEMIRNGDLRYGSTLFSESEQDYLNYVLNKSQFGNSLDLRNRYVHGTYSNDEKQQRNDYGEFLKVMVLMIGKINEEFCLREEILEKGEAY